MSIELSADLYYNMTIKSKKGMVNMKMVIAFDKRIYVGKGYECNRLIKKWEKKGVATIQDFQRDIMEDNDVYGIYIDRSGFYSEKPTIIMFESRSLVNILADWYGEEV